MATIPRRRCGDVRRDPVKCETSQGCGPHRPANVGHNAQIQPSRGS
ncbi:hypothetical protein PJI17_29660 [Mycobacterium kansasii]|uniref:Uncharacterized protein n=1 Tax=Mycobacterium kansasii TaxID=1768 RepID=A0A1V3XH19_MYCKA|nr:hypothetical protein BZL30_2558 [Mycobacterium kansasii]